MKTPLYLCLIIFCLSGCSPARLLRTEISAMQSAGLSVPGSDSSGAFANYSPSTIEHTALPLTERSLSGEVKEDAAHEMQQDKKTVSAFFSGSEIYITPSPADTTVQEIVEEPINYDDANNSLLVGFFALIFFPFGLLFGSVGIHVARKAIRQIRAEPLKYGGMVRAQIGLWLSIVSFSISAAFVLLICVFIIGAIFMF